jgi:hypothetical protein
VSTGDTQKRKGESDNTEKKLGVCGFTQLGADALSGGEAVVSKAGSKMNKVTTESSQMGPLVLSKSHLTWAGGMEFH